ncbi:MAG: thioredoxin domain-containing protein [Rickettsiales bacterium]
MNKREIIIAVLALIIGIGLGIIAPKLLARQETRQVAEGRVMLGDKGAKVELIEYSALGCEHCKNVHNKLFPQIKSKFIDSGKIKYELRSFVNSQNTLNATLALRCADSDNYYSFVEELFANINTWAARDASLGDLKKIAVKNGVSQDKFYACIEDKEAKAAILAEQNKSGVKSSPSFLINGEKLEGATDAAAISNAIELALQGKSANADFISQSKAVLAITDTDKVLGKKDAPVTIVEYASMSCSHCAKFHNDVLPQLKKDFIDTGKVKLVFRQFPHNAPALKAAMISQCSKHDYFGVIAKLFANQSEWAFNMDEFPTKLAAQAKAHGMNKADFDKCLSNKEIETKILAGVKQATDKLGVSSTPTFFINGTKGDHLHSVQEFRKAIEAASGK